MNRTIELVHRVFNHTGSRKLLLLCRLPLFVMGFLLLLCFAQQAWFWPAFGVAVIGEAIQLWCFASLDKKSVLAYNGLYKHTRNPMYLGRYILALGYILLLGNEYVFLAVGVIYYLYMWNRVQREEKTLKEIFGQPYTEYCERVNRFIPSFRGMPGGLLGFWKWRLFRQNHGLVNMSAVLLSFIIMYVYFVFFAEGMSLYE